MSGCTSPGLSQPNGRLHNAWDTCAGDIHQQHNVQGTAGRAEGAGGERQGLFVFALSRIENAIQTMEMAESVCHHRRQLCDKPKRRREKTFLNKVVCNADC